MGPKNGKVVLFISYLLVGLFAQFPGHLRRHPSVAGKAPRYLTSPSSALTTSLPLSKTPPAVRKYLALQQVRQSFADFERVHDMLLTISVRHNSMFWIALMLM